MPAKSRSDELAEKSRFVFQGTVKQVKATNLKAVAASERTVVVRVDHVIHAPEALAGFAGHEITVKLAEGEQVKSDQTFVFYTNGWVFGENLAVQSVGHEEATTPKLAALVSHPGDPVGSLKTREALTQAATADLIVSGRVSAVRLPEEEAAARASAVASGSTSEVISEHAPLWHEAVIDVDDVHRGTLRGKQVVVRFPSSSDVRWYRAPKFQTGQEGVFLLHKDQLQGGPTAFAAVSGVGPGVYTALHPSDVQPLDQLNRILTAARPGDG
jgi:hypothetical protein